MNKFAPIKVAAFKSMDKSFCCGDVGCNRDVVNVAKAEKSGVIRIRILVHGVAEEKQKVNFVAGDSGSDLFTAAVASAKEAGNFKTGCVGNKFSGSGSGAEFVFAENSAVSNTELNHKFFFGILRDNCNIHKQNLLFYLKPRGMYFPRILSERSRKGS